MFFRLHAGILCISTMPKERLHERKPSFLVEDEPAILKMGREMFERLGYAILTAENPNDALRFALEYDGKIHLLITDVVMPQMNGRNLSSQLVKNHPDLKPSTCRVILPM